MSIKRLSTPTNFRAPSIGRILSLHSKPQTSGGSTPAAAASTGTSSSNSSSVPLVSQGNPQALSDGIGSASILAYSSGVGYRVGDIVPCAFLTLGSFLIFWELASNMANAVPYKLNGVSPSTALCVLLGTGSASQATSAILYLAGSSANSSWYYLQNWFGMSAGLSIGPGLVNCGLVPYVAISPTGPAGNIILSGISPSTSMLTQL
jgi:hypothetical protein